MIYNIEGYLCNYGFCVKKKLINLKILELLKKYFKVKPEQNYENEKIPDINKYFDVYYQDDKYIVLPKFSANISININKINGKKNIEIDDNEYTKITFSIKKFKYSKQISNFDFGGKLRDYQELIVNEIFKQFNLDPTKPLDHNLSSNFPKGGIIKLSCGGGKCLGFNTPILMYNGTIKMVQNIIVGDKLMGDDSKARNVLGLARGSEQMYQIIQDYGEDYIVNSSHILSLYNPKINKIVDISIEDYLDLPNKYMGPDGITLTRQSQKFHMVKGGLYGYKVNIRFDLSQVPFEPYYFSNWIVGETTQYFGYSDMIKIKYYLYKTKYGSNIPDDYQFNIDDYFIPNDYKMNHHSIQLDILAGIIDSKVGWVNEDSYEIKLINTNTQLYLDIIFILNSLGLMFKSDKKNCNIKIYGKEISLIPTKKNIIEYDNIPAKNVSPDYFSNININYYKIKVNKLSKDNYYGFEIDGNKRFLLGDFTVTHNTMLAIYLSWKLGLKTLVVTHKEFLMDQWEKRIQQFTTAKIGRIRQNKIDVENKDIVIGMLRSLSTKDYPTDILHQFGLVIYDEVHHTGSRVDSQALLKTSAQYTIGLSATPERADGMTKVINWHVGNILYEMEKKYNYRVLVKKIFFRSNDILFREKKMWFQGRFAPNHTAMTENLTKMKTRNQLIVNFIDVLKGMGRKILILSYRVEHLELLKGLVDAKIKADGESHIYNSYYYMGKTKRTEKDMAEKDGHIIFATMQLAEEGLDIAHLDTVLFALPVSIQKDKKKRGKIKSSKALIQSIGRILRNDKLEDLTQIPLVIDISDMFSIYSGWSDKRNEIYEKKNWYLQNFYWEDLEYQFKAGQDKKINQMNIIFDDITDEDFIEKNLMLTEEEAKQMAKEEEKEEKEEKLTSSENNFTDGTSDSNTLDNDNNNKTHRNKIESFKKSLIQQNNSENIHKPIVSYGFGKKRY